MPLEREGFNWELPSLRFALIPQPGFWLAEAQSVSPCVCLSFRMSPSVVGTFCWV